MRRADEDGECGLKLWKVVACSLCAATWGAVTCWRQEAVKTALRDENEVVIGMKRSATLMV